MKFDSPIRQDNVSKCQISFSDFLSVMLASELSRNLPAVQFAFNLLDISRSGCITSSNLFFFSYLFGLSIKKREIEESMREYDNKMDFQTFVHMLTQSKGIALVIL